MRLSFTGAALAVLLSCTTLANAEVRVIDDAFTHAAQGDMYTAAEAGRESAYIDCQVSGNQMSCYAWDGVEKFAGCWTTDPNRKRLFPALGRSSYVTFTWNPNTFECTSIFINNHNRSFGARSPAATTQETPPWVDNDAHFAIGTMNHPPTDALRHEQITCTVRSDNFVECLASDHNGTLGRCIAFRDSPWQTFEDMRLAVIGINESSYVYFQWDATSPINTCTSITVDNASYNLR